MSVKSLKIKNESMFYPNDMIQLNSFDSQLLKINKRENRENNNIYYISYKINKPKHDINSINNLYLVVDHLFGAIEKINGSKDRYLVINENSLVGKKNISFFYLWDSIIDKIKSSTIITHQGRYENGGFYLTIDNIKSYFSFSNNTVLLDMIFSNDDQKIKYIKCGKKILKLLIMEMEN